mgnify:CR=1 FL=1
MEKELAAEYDLRAQTAAFGQRNLKLNQENSEDEAGGVFSNRPVTNQIAIKAFDQSTEDGTLNHVQIFS